MSTTGKPEPIHEGIMPRPYEGVREWLELVESMGELKHINGADWNLEIGTMAELIYRERPGTIPAWLVLIASKAIRRDSEFSSEQHSLYRRLALAAGLPNEMASASKAW